MQSGLSPFHIEENETQVAPVHVPRDPESTSLLSHEASHKSVLFSEWSWGAGRWTNGQKDVGDAMIAGNQLQGEPRHPQTPGRGPPSCSLGPKVTCLLRDSCGRKGSLQFPQ